MTTNKLNRRNFLKLGSAAAATTILSACGGTQTPAQQQPAGQATAEQPAAQVPAGEGTTIQWWVGWGNLTAAVDKIKETPQFKEMIGKNTLEFKPSVKSEALLTALAGGTSPDGESNIGAYPDLWYRGALQPVDDM